MIRIGQTIKIKVYDDRKKKFRIEKWEIANIYPFMISCKNEMGFRRGLSIGDLVTLGLLKQSDEIEAMRY